MADNVAYTPGTGATVAADDVGGVLYQRVKPVWGVDGSVVDASATNPLPVVQTGAVPAGTNNIGDVDVLTLPGVAGNVAHDAVDSGDPLKIGGKASNTAPTEVAAGDRVNAWMTLSGAQATAIYDHFGNGSAVVSLPGDGLSNADRGLRTISFPTGYNGATSDMLRTEPGTTGFLGIGGSVAHDAVDAGNPLKIGGYAKAAAPTDVADADRVAAWFLRNGALVNQLSAAGALIGGDATNGLDVDVTRLPALPAGTNNIGDVDVLTLPNVTLAAGTNTNEVVGDVAEDAALAGNPQRVGFRASTAIPAAMSADNDIVTPWANRSGAPVVTQAPHVGLNSDPWNLVHEAAQYTTAQTSAVLVAGGASEKIVVTKVQIQAGGTVAGTLQLYFGTGAFSRGTSRAIFDGEFAPSATSKPGVVMDGPFIAGTNGDDLMVTGVGAINPLTINVWYYVVT